MKTIKLLTFLTIFLLISSCTTQMSNPQSTPASEAVVMDAPAPTTETTLSLLKTTIGDFRIASIRLVDQAHENVAPEGYKFLLVGLTQPDMEKLIAGEFSFETFQSMTSDSTGEIYISGSDGSKTEYRGMGGWLDNNEDISDDFVVGFMVPIAETYTLYWPDNPPIPLNIEP